LPNQPTSPKLKHVAIPKRLDPLKATKQPPGSSEVINSKFSIAMFQFMVLASSVAKEKSWDTIGFTLNIDDKL